MSDSNSSDQYNKGGMIAFLFSMAFVFIFFIYIVAVHPGIDLQENIKDPPGASAAKEEVIDMTKYPEPWLPNEQVAKHGAKVYVQNCAMCHGDTGLGDGAAGQALNPKPRNLVEGPWKLGGGLIGLYKVLENGIPGGSMASFKHLAVADRWAMVNYIQSITKAKVVEDPKLVEEFAKTAK
jgi:mono/diheme cytochrome c family protein